MEKIDIIKTLELGSILAAIIALIVSIINILLTITQSKKQRTAEIITNKRVEWMQDFKQYISIYTSYTSYYYNKNIPKDMNKYLKEILEATTNVKLHLNLKGAQDREIIDIMENLNISLEKILNLSSFQKENSINQKTIEYYIRCYPDIFTTPIKSFLLDKGLDENDLNNPKELLDKCNVILDKHSNKQDLFNLISDEIQGDLITSINKMKNGTDLLLLLAQIYLKAEWERVKIEAESGKFYSFDFDKEYMEIRTEMQDNINQLQKDSEIELEPYLAKNKIKASSVIEKLKPHKRTPFQWSRIIFGIFFLGSMWLAVLGKITSNNLSVVATLLSTTWLTIELMMTNIFEMRR